MEQPKNDLADRTYEFAKNVRLFVKALPKTIQIIEDSKEVTYLRHRLRTVIPSYTED